MTLELFTVFVYVAAVVTLAALVGVFAFFVISTIDHSN